MNNSFNWLINNPSDPFFEPDIRRAFVNITVVDKEAA